MLRGGRHHTGGRLGGMDDWGELIALTYGVVDRWKGVEVMCGRVAKGLGEQRCCGSAADMMRAHTTQMLLLPDPHMSIRRVKPDRCGVALAGRKHQV